MEVNLVHH